jgi:hypothetical protein
LADFIFFFFNFKFKFNQFYDFGGPLNVTQLRANLIENGGGLDALVLTTKAGHHGMLPFAQQLLMAHR